MNHSLGNSGPEKQLLRATAPSLPAAFPGACLAASAQVGLQNQAEHLGEGNSDFQLLSSLTQESGEDFGRCRESVGIQLAWNSNGELVYVLSGLGSS